MQGDAEKGTWNLMISFRIKEPSAIDWTQVAFDGPDEESAAHLLAWCLAREGWTILVAKEAQPTEWLDINEADELWGEP